MNQVRQPALLLIGIFFLSAARATVLTFDGIGSGQGVSQVPDDYGDRVTGTTDTSTGYMYGEGNGFTPSVVVEYNSNTVTPFSLFGTNYGDLANVLGHNFFNVQGEVVLRPDSGSSVILNSFDVGGWNDGPWPDSRILVLDDGDAVLFDSGLITVAAGHLTFPGDTISSNSALRIQLFDYGNLGLDNVNFDQVMIPIPAAAWLLASALGLLGWVRRQA